MVRKEREESEALGGLRFPSDVSEHMVPSCQVRYLLCILILSTHTPLSPFPLSPSLGTIFVHYLRDLLPFISLFWVTSSQRVNHPLVFQMGQSS